MKKDARNLVVAVSSMMYMRVQFVCLGAGAEPEDHDAKRGARDDVGVAHSPKGAVVECRSGDRCERKNTIAVSMKMKRIVPRRVICVSGDAASKDDVHAPARLWQCFQFKVLFFCFYVVIAAECW